MDTALGRRILIEADQWLMTPFHHKGRIKGIGVDCGGFIHGVYSNFFDLKPFPTEYPEDWTLHEGSGELYLNYIKDYTVEVSAPVLGGVALFRIGRRWGHGAICCDGNKPFIHAWGRTGMGSVQKSSRGFFQHRGALFPVKYFDLVI
jgi:hypothetical protein